MDGIQWAKDLKEVLMEGQAGLNKNLVGSINKILIKDLMMALEGSISRRILVSFSRVIGKEIFLKILATKAIIRIIK